MDDQVTGARFCRIASVACACLYAGQNIYLKFDADPASAKAHGSRRYAFTKTSRTPILRGL
jgi:hypothetical protein